MSWRVSPLLRLIRRAIRPWRRIESATARSMVSRRRSRGVCEPMTAPVPSARPGYVENHARLTPSRAQTTVGGNQVRGSAMKRATLTSSPP